MQYIVVLKCPQSHHYNYSFVCIIFVFLNKQSRTYISNWSNSGFKPHILVQTTSHPIPSNICFLCIGTIVKLSKSHKIEFGKLHALNCSLVESINQSPIKILACGFAFDFEKPFIFKQIEKMKEWYFVTKIVLTYCEKKNVLVIEKNF